MSRNEDYLDNLLNSVTTKLSEFDDDFEQNRESLRESYQTQGQLPPKTQSALDDMRGDNFLKDYEADLGMDSEDDFIREFERELEGEANGAFSQTDDVSSQLDQIMNQDSPLEVNTLSDKDMADVSGQVDTMSGTDPELEDIFAQQPDMISGEAKETAEKGEAGLPEGMEGLEDLFQEGAAADAQKEAGQSEADAPDQAKTPDLSMDQILNESDDKALEDIGQMLDAQDGGKKVKEPIDPENDPFTVAPDFDFEPASLEEEPKEKKVKEKNPNGLFARIMRILFGTPEELDPEAAAKYEASKPPEPDPAQLKEQKKQEKELKKQQKKEAAEQKKKEKEEAKAAKAAEKAAKPKKEKKPKEKKETGPPEPKLPKVPVAIMWILALSLMVFILLGSSLVGTTTAVAQAKAAFSKGDYVSAYTSLQNVKRSGSQEDLYQSALALAGIQTEIDSYQALMENKQYELALDALVRGMGRCQIHSADAQEWGVEDKLTKMRKQINKLLNEQFDVSERQAKKLYKIKKRTDYTLALEEILEKLDLI